MNFKSKRRLITLSVSCTALMTFFMISPAPAQPLAFPEALGLGAQAAGGRGGDVYHVTTLNDDGPGSLRFGVENGTGARTVVFEVGGTIDLLTELEINRSNLTIAGQTAPGQGIQLAGQQLQIKEANDIVIRYLRVRAGDRNLEGMPGGLENADPDDTHAIEIKDAQRVVLDHVSMSWGVDENLSISESNFVTVQNSIISEALTDSLHSEGRHGMGMLLQGNGSGGITIAQNLLANNWKRNPVLGPEGSSGTDDLDVEIVNNVIYNWGERALHDLDGTSGERVNVNLIGNYFIAGPETELEDGDAVPGSLNDPVDMFHEANVLDDDLDTLRDGTPITDDSFDLGSEVNLLSTQHGFASTVPLTALQAYEAVLATAGASVSRDDTDSRLISELLALQGRLIDSQSEVGGYGTLTGGPAVIDLDRDGMADAWELSVGLNPNDAADRNGFDFNSEFTNLEIYLNTVAIPEPAAGALMLLGVAGISIRRRRTSALTK